MKNNIIQANGFYLLGLAFVMYGCTGGESGTPASRPEIFRTASSGAGPAKGRFTIVLGQYAQEDRAELARALEQKARQVLKTNDIWMHNAPEGLLVNFGHFEKDTPESPIQEELKRVRKLYKSLEAGQYQFCYIREIESPDPPAPMEWNLLNSQCAYALEIAVYYNVPDKEYYDRKASAVEAVRNLRTENQDQAFFVHGQKESRVYVGCLPAGISPALVQLLQKKYPYHYENGFKVFSTVRQGGRTVRLPEESFLVNVGVLKMEVMF